MISTYFEESILIDTYTIFSIKFNLILKENNAMI